MASTSVTLLGRLRQPSNQAAWTRFVQLYTPLLFCWAGKARIRGADAEDLVQEVFRKLVHELPTFQYDAGKSFRAWLYTVMRTTWKNMCRQRVVPPSEDMDLYPDGADPFGELEADEYRRFLVARALELMQSQFEEKTWQACWQTAVEERPAAKVARELGLSPNAVYVAKSRVLAQLRQELAGLVE